VPRIFVPSPHFSALVGLNCPESDKIPFFLLPRRAPLVLRRNIVISTLRHNIFIIKGADPGNGRQTVHTCVVDNGDIVSACILMAGTTDLSLVSLVLAKSYGSSLDEETVGMLSSSYGLPAELLA
jgi:hypothetical protein